MMLNTLTCIIKKLISEKKKEPTINLELQKTFTTFDESMKTHNLNIISIISIVILSRR